MVYLNFKFEDKAYDPLINLLEMQIKKVSKPIQDGSNIPGRVGFQCPLQTSILGWL
jgi:hypothetical protein